MVAVAIMAGSNIRPVATSTPDGASKAKIGAPCTLAQLITLATSPHGAPFRLYPIRPSIISSVVRKGILSSKRGISIILPIDQFKFRIDHGPGRMTKLGPDSLWHDQNKHTYLAAGLDGDQGIAHNDGNLIDRADKSEIEAILIKGKPV